MKTDIEKTCKWIYEILEEEPKEFANFFKNDIYEFLNIENLIAIKNKKVLQKTLKSLCGAKFESLENCFCKKDVRKWVNNITSYIIMKNEVEPIISDYFSA